MGKYDDLNSVLLEGRLVKDPILKEFANQSMICNFSIANNFSYKMKDGKYKSDASFIDIKVWGRSGQLCHQYLKKGSIVRLRGRITQDRWEDENGSKKSRLYVTAGHVEFRQIASTGEKKQELKKKEDTESIAKEVILHKQDDRKDKVDKKKDKPIFTKILDNKEGVLPDELSTARFGDIPF
jgi:single-strand DNA-binding protein